MTTISLMTTDQLLVVTVKPKIASGDKNSVELYVEFDAHWDGYARSAVFFTSENETVYEVVLMNDKCIIPHEVLAESGTLYIGVRGVNSVDSAVKTSTLVKYKIDKGAPVGDGTTVEPTPDVYQQLLTLANSKAPGGYGLGTGGVAFNLASIDIMKSNGWFYTSSATGYYIGTVPLYYLHLRVDSWKDTAGSRRIIQTLYCDNCLIRRITDVSGNTWGEWEWVNPPMAVGVEYRTTECWKGKAVYTKLFDFGALPSISTKSLSHGVTNMDSPISMTVSVARDDGSWSFALPSQFQHTTQLTFDANNIVITTAVDWSAYKAMACLRYTKK